MASSQDATLAVSLRVGRKSPPMVALCMGTLIVGLAVVLGLEEEVATLEAMGEAILPRFCVGVVGNRHIVLTRVRVLK